MMFTVKWEIDVEEDELKAEGLEITPRGAAEYARRIQRDKESTATIFDVKDGSRVEHIDLLVPCSDTDTCDTCGVQVEDNPDALWRYKDTHLYCSQNCQNKRRGVSIT